MSTTFGFHCGKTLIKENYSLDFSCSESPVLVPPVAQASDVSEPKTRTAYRHMASLDLSLLDLLSRIFIKKGFFHDFLIAVKSQRMPVITVKYCCSLDLF